MLDLPRVPRTLAAAAVLALTAQLTPPPAIAGTAQVMAETVFSDGFEECQLSAWSATAGFVAPVALYGRVWHDWIANGELDLGVEGGPSGWTVWADVDGSGTFDPSTDPWVESGGEGLFELACLPAGAYELFVEDRPGWLVAVPAAGAYPLSLGAGDAVGGLDFGVRRESDAWDYGDAPDPTLPTFFQHGGAAHLVASGLRLGALVDAESNGSPSAGATGDGADEDGVAFPFPLVRGETVTVEVTASAAAVLDAWIDFGRDGFWFQTVDHVVDGLNLSAGLNSVQLAIPADASFGPTFARFRLSSAGGLGPTGDAADGEVEDYAVTLVPEHPDDFGDAPDAGYLTLGGSGGPIHTLAVDTFLGDNVDGETDGQPHPEALGDDGDNFDDEDGVEFVSHVVPGSPATVEIEASASAYVEGWVDLDHDGTWDAGEHVVVGEPIVRGPNRFTFTVPPTSPLGDTVSRFRMVDQAGATPYGPLLLGEVEDYGVELEALDWGDAPDIDEGPFFTKLMSAAAEPHDELGASVALSGAWALAGSWFDGDGSATFFHFDGSAWVEDDVVTHADTYRFGYDVAVDGTRAVIGQYGTSAAYVYEHDGLSWNEKKTLTAAASHNLDAFGKAVDISGSRIVVGADSFTASERITGAAWVFEDDGSGWDEAAMLTAPDGAHGDGFGRSVSIDGDVAVVGAPGNGDLDGAGAAYVFRFTGSAWELEQRLIASDASERQGFGASVSADGGRIAVGSGSGTYVFAWDGAVWAQEQKLAASGYLGGFVGLSGDWLVAGSFGDGTEGYHAGAAKLFHRTAGSWSLHKSILSYDADDGQEFGRAVAIEGMRALIGAPGANSGDVDWTGAAYVVDWLVDPNRYPTLDVNDGAYHTLVPGVFLAPGVDMESDGQPDDLAQGDDLGHTDDEGGVTFLTPLVAGVNAVVQVDASTFGFLDAWIDFNNDGDWDDPAEKIFGSTPLVPGPNILGFQVPPWAIPTDQSDPTYGRFRFSLAGGLGTGGHAPDGEVEDYPVTIEGPEAR